MSLLHMSRWAASGPPSPSISLNDFLLCFIIQVFPVSFAPCARGGSWHWYPLTPRGLLRRRDLCWSWNHYRENSERKFRERIQRHAGNPRSARGKYRVQERGCACAVGKESHIRALPRSGHQQLRTGILIKLKLMTLECSKQLPIQTSGATVPAPTTTPRKCGIVNRCSLHASRRSAQSAGYGARIKLGASRDKHDGRQSRLGRCLA